MAVGYDVIVVGAGIVGLAHAWVASRRGLRVLVVERDPRCVGASVRNVGVVAVTGQGAGDTWRRARRSREVWEGLAAPAGIRIEHRGLWVMARRPEAAAVLEAFCATPMGERCELLTPHEAAAMAPELRTDRAQALLYSPHELRVEPREALPRLADWLQREAGVDFIWGEGVLAVEPPHVQTSRRGLVADRVVVCSGSEWRAVGATCLTAPPPPLTRLQMLRVRPHDGFRLTAAVMSDLSLLRCRGYADLPATAALRARLEDEEPDALAHGVHLIAVQGSDGQLVVGESNHADDAASPFASAEVEAVILRELRAVADLAALQVTERWVGTYPADPAADVRIEAPHPAVRAVLVTSGTVASTAFALAEDVFDAW